MTKTLLIAALTALCLRTAYGGAFTEVTVGTDVQDKAILNEIYTSWNERRTAKENSTNNIVALIVAGDDIQDKDIYQDVQEWLERHCVSFLNHNIDPATTNALQYFTVANR